MILVTGATGLLGGHLTHDLISSGKKVRAIFRTRRSIDKTREIFSYYSNDPEKYLREIEWVQGDVNDVHLLNQIMRDVDEVYHCAGVVSFRKKERNRVLETNVNGTANMLNAALDNDVKKFCHVSSIAAFGRPEENVHLIDESFQREENDGSSVYSLSKYLAELEVWRAMEEGLNAVIINPSTIIGSGNWETGSSALFTKIWRGLVYYTEGINGFVDVRDVVKAMKTLMEKNIFRDQYILVGENLSFRELFATIANNFNLKEPSIRANKFISGFAWRMESILCAVHNREPVITRESTRIARDIQYYSNRKIRDRINLEFIPINHSLREVTENFLRVT